MSCESSVDGTPLIVKHFLIDNDDDMSCGSSVDGTTSDTDHLDQVDVTNGQDICDPSYDKVTTSKESSNVSSHAERLSLDMNGETVDHKNTVGSKCQSTVANGAMAVRGQTNKQPDVMINTDGAIDTRVNNQSLSESLFKDKQFESYLLPTNNESDSNIDQTRASWNLAPNKGDGPIVNTFKEDDAEFEFALQPVRRSTSLKTGRSDVDRPTGPKKAVRFADALGLDLASVRHIVNGDEPPNVPRSAMKDLYLADDYIERVSSASLRFMDVFQLCLCFSPPGTSPEFMRRVEERRVALETCSVQDSSRVISGVVRVANIAYEKKVGVRWTINAWVTYSDCIATYRESSKDGRTDTFIFEITLPEHFGYVGRLEFSIVYETGNETFWDSNHGVNYHVECYVKSVIPRGGEDEVEDERRLGPNGRNCFY